MRIDLKSVLSNYVKYLFSLFLMFYCFFDIIYLYIWFIVFEYDVVIFISV